jgi:hypothetical protein
MTDIAFGNEKQHRRITAPCRFPDIQASKLYRQGKLAQQNFYFLLLNGRETRDRFPCHRSLLKAAADVQPDQKRTKVARHIQ